MARRPEQAQNPRRKPRQSRSQETSRAIRDAFVRLLGEKPYEQVTIREIVLVAGVGLGTFYEYFGSKDALARACVHLRTKELLQAMQRRRAELGAYDLATGIAAGIDAQARIYEAAPREWAQHFLLERHKSDLKYYLSAYDLFLAEWRGLLEGASDWPKAAPADNAALVVFTLLYGMFARALMAGGGAPALKALRGDLQRAAVACVTALAAAPLANARGLR